MKQFLKRIKTKKLDKKLILNKFINLDFVIRKMLLKSILVKNFVKNFKVLFLNQIKRHFKNT